MIKEDSRLFLGSNFRAESSKSILACSWEPLRTLATMVDLPPWVKLVLLDLYENILNFSVLKACQPCVIYLRALIYLTKELSKRTEACSLFLTKAMRVKDIVPQRCEIALDRKLAKDVNTQHLNAKPTKNERIKMRQGCL